MKFFENFPLVWHTLPDNDQVLLQNLTRRVMPTSKIKHLDGLLLPYTISDGETPRQFAQRFYGSFELFWVVPLINGIHDLTSQWPKPEQRIVDELMERYGIDGMYDTRHYVNEYGVETDPAAMRIAYGMTGVTDDAIIGDFGLRAVSYHDYEIAQNEKLRDVQVLHPDYLTDFVNQFDQELKNG
ncbi:baseplate wedge component [Erwinia phage phiEa2809]|uniref:Baseplate wedge component n=1 Tax=Erwinia phage phiEa2809 TaxID=1564096 RepID=A0A0A0YXC0_9CAUD|nr:baseplate wedge subunit [Erwinia phage phiEa2809]AIX13033.1 baseplate wedge component [Erwinia phage phiEa2809]